MGLAKNKIKFILSLNTSWVHPRNIPVFPHTEITYCRVYRECYNENSIEPKFMKATFHNILNWVIGMPELNFTDEKMHIN